MPKAENPKQGPKRKHSAPTKCDLFLHFDFVILEFVWDLGFGVWSLALGISKAERYGFRQPAEIPNKFQYQRFKIQKQCRLAPEEREQ